jgi:hypothetical protein
MTRIALFSFLTVTVSHARSEHSAVTFGRHLGRTARRADYRSTALRLAVPPPFAGQNYTINPKDLFPWVQFGPRAIPPFWEERLELSAGAQGAYENVSIGSANGLLFPPSGGGGNFSAGAAMAARSSPGTSG